MDRRALLKYANKEGFDKLPMLQPDKIKDSLHAYQLSKRGNSLRVMFEAVHWGKRGAWVNTISPGIIITPACLSHSAHPIPLHSLNGWAMNLTIETPATSAKSWREFVIHFFSD